MSIDCRRWRPNWFAARSAVIVAAGTAPALAAKAATTTIPIVFATGSDPVSDGLVASLNRPGGNVTGVSLFRLSFGGEAAGAAATSLCPRRRRSAMLVNPNSPDTEADARDVQAAAQPSGSNSIVLEAGNADEIETRLRERSQRAAGRAARRGRGPFFNVASRTNCRARGAPCGCRRSMPVASLPRPAA